MLTLFLPAVVPSPLHQVTGLDLVKRQEFGRLAEMLRGEFQPLARLLLLLGWPQCPNVTSARTLLQVLHHQQVRHFA